MLNSSVCLLFLLIVSCSVCLQYDYSMILHYRQQRCGLYCTYVDASFGCLQLGCYGNFTYLKSALLICLSFSLSRHVSIYLFFDLSSVFIFLSLSCNIYMYVYYALLSFRITSQSIFLIDLLFFRFRIIFYESFSQLSSLCCLCLSVSLSLSLSLHLFLCRLLCPSFSLTRVLSIDSLSIYLSIPFYILLFYSISITLSSLYILINK